MQIPATLFLPMVIMLASCGEPNRGVDVPIPGIPTLQVAEDSGRFKREVPFYNGQCEPPQNLEQFAELLAKEFY